jgi:hypothetical protein
MLQPDFKEFKKKAKEGNLIPVYREIQVKRKARFSL